jgi:hypothetical protein
MKKRTAIFLSILMTGTFTFTGSLSANEDSTPAEATEQSEVVSNDESKGIEQSETNE